MMSVVTTALVIGVVLVGWTVLPLPLAVLVGRAIRAGRLVVPLDGALTDAPPAAVPATASVVAPI